MKKMDCASPLRRFYLGCFLTGIAFCTPSCNPQVVRSPQPTVPTSASEMVADTENLEKLIEAGKMERRELELGRDQAQRVIEQLSSEKEPDGLMLLSLKRAKLQLDLYEGLLNVQRDVFSSRSKRAEVAEKSSALLTAYIRKVIELEQNFDLMPGGFGGIAAGETELEVERLPPPTAARLLPALREGRYSQIEREVEGAGPEAPSLMEPDALAAYALALGAQGKFEEALDASDRLKKLASSPVVLELGYNRALWLVKLGNQAQAREELGQVDRLMARASQTLEALQRRTTGAEADLERNSTRFIEALVDIRLQLGRQEYEAARLACTRLLERETAAEALERIEKLLAEIDRTENEAFRLGIEELELVLELPGGLDAANEAADMLAERFKGRQYQARINELRWKINELREEERTGKRADRAVSTAVIESSIDERTGQPVPVDDGATKPAGKSSADETEKAKQESGKADSEDPRAQEKASPSEPQELEGEGDSEEEAATSKVKKEPRAEASQTRKSVDELPEDESAVASTDTEASGDADVKPTTREAEAEPTSTETEAGKSPTAVHDAGEASGDPSESEGAEASGEPSESEGEEAAAKSSASNGQAGDGPAGKTKTAKSISRPTVEEPGAPNGGEPIATTARAPAKTTARGTHAAAEEAGGAEGTVESSPEPPPVWLVTLEQGRQQLTEGKHREAIATFESLRGTPVAEKAEIYRLKAIDQQVQQVRERVAKQYVRAQQLRTNKEKLKLLGEIHAQLKAALEEFPETSLRAKAEHNLKVLAQELKRLDPNYFQDSLENQEATPTPKSDDAP